MGNSLRTCIISCVIVILVIGLLMMALLMIPLLMMALLVMVLLVIALLVIFFGCYTSAGEMQAEKEVTVNSLVSSSDVNVKPLSNPKHNNKVLFEVIESFGCQHWSWRDILRLK